MEMNTRTEPRKFLPPRKRPNPGRILRRVGPENSEFETCPDWVPVMDTGQQFAWIALKTMGEHGFDQRANRVAKVRNVSSVGSQILLAPQSNKSKTVFPG